MRPPAWLERLQCLAAHLPGHGIGADLTALSETDLWGVYRFLVRASRAGA